MKSEREKMLSGEMYNPHDPELAANRQRTRQLLQRLNAESIDQSPSTSPVLAELLPRAASDFWLQPPFFCDYGTNIEISEGVFMNFNCVLLDVTPIRIGARSLFGPAVQIYAATHPLSAKERAGGLEAGQPVNIGSDCWIGGGAIICPGVSIGDGTVVGAGSVVTRDLPAQVLAAGNPCRILRSLLP